MHWTDVIQRYAAQYDVDLSPLQINLGLGVGAVVVLAVVRYLSSSSSNVYHGPGPKGVPVLGNAADLPKKDDYKVYASWRHKYGEMVYLSVLGQPIYILNSLRTATELMNKRAMIYSDRPIMIMAQELVGWKRTPVLTSSNDPRYSRYRKLFHTALRKERVREMAPLQEKSSHQMLQLILDKPDDFVKHIRYCIGAVITKVTYDYDMKPEGDEFVELAEISADTFSQAAAPGAWLVDIFPWMRHIPAWFPGARFQRIAREWKAVNDYLHSKPYNDVKAQMAAGTHHGSVTSHLLTNAQSSTVDEDGEVVVLDDEEENRIMWVVGAIYSGGADTTVSALTTFVLAMVLYPGAQHKAHEEIDRVLGKDRLPVMSDRENLPYVEALFKEVLRWHPVAPLGVPHRLTKEDKFEGVTLPAGSTVISNIWAMGHTEADGNEFKPERHLHNSKEGAATDPREYVFGFGRRICPGKELADAGVWLGIVSLLAAFRFGKKPDGKGGYVEVKEEYAPGIISHPMPFACSIVPRHSSTAALIRSAIARDREH
ncbi:O-methylsterigmatocystin oxidoreductase Short=OMST oxidoreductase; AltName: Full=Aflatoxin B synthase; AltName: Full=Aflatoxin biosynthesis protein Q; AltName: Full=Cytochrome P450 64 [Serendipita indica DSM 11827]|nr:O-methylsterigmatocystin oxidoreductase Short=OMST oxidoreductase; AltName: Full=Aflatoxin B synthase; AltName: Full=Aflatoxin biosynthesis protein Q; AltName: Full=Cytochrome P450 64 [Serendipita indica DSM 11827]